MVSLQRTPNMDNSNIKEKKTRFFTTLTFQRIIHMNHMIGSSVMHINIVHSEATMKICKRWAAII